MTSATPGTTPSTLSTRLSGSVIRRGDAGYDDARKVWNGMIDRSPAIIVRCGSTEDVVAAVNFAREHGLLVAVRGGGHNAAGLGSCDDGIVIDLSGMRGVTVDAERRIARVQGGARWREMD
ncbi:MAG: linked oxidoreductase, partial [Geminicoccaceae bacterium]|nr:linked oxidoreductase [Geminicoccaceae bacterium]